MLSCFMSRKKREKTHLSESTGCLCPTSHPCNTKQRHALRLVQSALADEKIELNFNFNLMVNKDISGGEDFELVLKEK